MGGPSFAILPCTRSTRHSKNPEGRLLSKVRSMGNLGPYRPFKGILGILNVTYRVYSGYRKILSRGMRNRKQREIIVIEAVRSL